MPVNMDPTKRRTFSESEQKSAEGKPEVLDIDSKKLDEETKKDSESELADAETSNLIGSDPGFG